MMTHSRRAIRLGVCATLTIVAGGFFVVVGSPSATHGQRAQEPKVFDERFLSCESARCEAPAQEVATPFSHLAVEWERERRAFVRLEERTGWSDWVELKGEPDGPDHDSEHLNQGFIDALDATRYQIATDIPSRVTATPIAVPPLPAEARRGTLKTANVESSSTLAILSRAAWLSGIDIGSDTTNSKWTPAYHEIKKIIIHHTASVIKDTTGDGIIDGNDYRNLSRAIYTYHTHSQRWGDVGYHFLIDPDGTIYEGRQGGDGISGGHAYRGRACTRFGTSSNMTFNDGTIGIALLGTYAATQMTPAQKESLSSLIAEKAWEFEFEPLGYSTFQESFYPNVVGHRDVDCTDCPGDTLASGLSEIRQIAQQKFLEYSQARSKVFRAQNLAPSTPVLSLKPGEQKTIDFTFKNTGTATWRSYGANAVALSDESITSRLASLESVHLASASTYTPTSTPALTASLVEPNVRPGEVGTFRVTINEPPAELRSEKSFVLTLGSRGWFGSAGTVKMQLENTGLEWAALLVDSERSGALFAYKEKTAIPFVFENRGTREWKRGDVVLVMTDAHGKPLFKDATWKKPDLRVSFQEKSVKPGERANFLVKGSASALGMFEHTVSLAHGQTKVSGSDYTPFVGEVRHRRAAELVYRLFPDALLKGSTSSASMTLRNVGIDPWEEPTLYAFASNGKSPSGFSHKTWKGTVAVVSDTKTEYGEMVSPEFTIQAPKVAGMYRMSFMLKDGKAAIPIIANGKSTSGIPATAKVTEPKKTQFKKIPTSKKTSTKK